MSDDPTDFRRRHIGAVGADRAGMLAELGYDSLDALLDAAVPPAIRTAADGSALPPAAGEARALAELREIAGRNVVTTSMIGLGYHQTVTPPVIARNVLENPSWYTAYTPYQPEISQGRLEALLNFQTMITDLTGLAIANASMLDEATAVVEGMLLARRASRSKSPVFLVDADVLPQTRRLLAHRAAALGIELHDTAYDSPPGEVFGALIQYPGASGRLWDPRAAIAAVQAAGGLVVMAADPLALTLLTPPGELGADIAVGSTQRFGVPMAYGGPHAGYLAVRAGLERQLPGRLVGVSVDAAGRTAYRLSLQAREQHIRREKATSNICTAQVLLAVMASMYAVYHGPDGLRAIAEGVAERTRLLASLLIAGGVRLAHEQYFDTVRLRDVDAAAVFARLRAIGVTPLVVDEHTVQLTVDEVVGADTIRSVAAAVTQTGGDAGAPVAGSVVPATLVRTSAYLEHPTFHRYRSETAMMRYLRRLADLDYALDRGMIPLGSCTMKLNAAAEMAAITWPGFTDLHPFAPAEDAAGYRRLVTDLEAWLADITGYDAVSLQPNAGSQGELAGLLAIRGYHRANGEEARIVCLIPSSAHGTNAASAALAGMKVVVVACDAEGNVDLDDLAAKIETHRDVLAALMITYPSTHGVYEMRVREICDAVHVAGGQVYIDGANLNALVGYARFGEFGGDVSHLNLHKTFAIPHGGGGPGVGPVAARAHLAPYLPRGEENPVAAAPYGSAGVLPISWAYVRMMGADGLREATAAAVLAANYVAARLGDVFPVLYTGSAGLVAHECILDLRPLRDATGVTVDDVAKRLVDYGFHAPTMSFPVAGTLMVEPTESEDLEELDRFVAAMRGIRAEADAVGSGSVPGDDNVLVNAPHTAADLVGDWDHAYSREQAVYPLPGMARHKYWPPVSRIDQAWGDRHLACSCPPPEAFV
ncbi:aminomethyl-transferring glycine dehydrogenase [Propionicicella superfundia]|uniref:aminomethyl-transferring glycine dehydrogenase n=1 Tax=Propionicicella superfundia TaxID=348582 RepID=UPI000419E110|nr:aminomethyl-transferring glycine dehydrogenase [Propionicicella superfundia]